MINKFYVLVAALVGVITGFLTIHSFLAHSWVSIIFWVIVGIVVVYFSPDKKTAIVAGAIFGFFDIEIWLITGFQGSTSQLRGFTIMLFVLSLFGALCGAIGAYLLSKLFRKI